MLYIGGAGYVGGLILPELTRHHAVRVLDLKAPSVDCEHVIGDATDPATLSDAMSGVDVVLHGAMAHKYDWTGSVSDTADAFDVNLKSVYLALRVAALTGVRHAVHLGSLSVYRDLLRRPPVTEETPPDAVEPYGLTKRLAEQVCQAAVEEWGMSVTVLRLAWPTSDDLWPQWLSPQQGPITQRTESGEVIAGLAASDLAAAVLAAIGRRDGYTVLAITGDHTGRLADLTRAREVLGWQPRRRLSDEGEP